MFRKLFRRKQQADPNYTDQLIAAGMLEAAQPAAKGLVSYVQAAANAWSEALALCDVEGTSALTRTVRADIGNDLIMYGGTILYIKVDGRSVTLERPLTAHRVKHGAWQLTVGEPLQSSTITVLHDECIFIPWSTQPNDPYAVLPPWKNLSGDAARELESALHDELKGPIGSVLFLSNPISHPDSDARKKSGQAYRELLDFKGAGRGKLAVLNSPSQTMSKAFTSDSVGKPFRVGAAPPQALVDLRTQYGEEILAMCSIPPAMLMAQPGPAQIVGRRHFERTIVNARAAMISERVSDALNQKIEMKYPARHRSDNSTSARTVAALVKAGMSLSEAKQLAGLS